MESSKAVKQLVVHNEQVDLKAIITQCMQKWYLFVVFGLAGLTAGYLYVRYSPSSYQVKATLFVPRMATGIEAGFEGLLPGGLIENQSEVYNQMEILKSYYLHHEAAYRLNWRTSWFRKDRISLHNLLRRKDMFHWVSFYRDEPFRVQEIEGQKNLTGIRLYVEPMDQNRYRLKASFEMMREEKNQQVSFEATGLYGQPFSNEYFHFILYPAQSSLPREDCQYSFVFNNLSQIASYYRSKLSVGLNDKESDIIRLQLSGKNPQREMDYLNGLMNVYIENKVNFQTATQQQSLHFIEKQLEGVSDSLSTAGSSFSQFRSRNQLINVSKQGSQVMAMLQELETEKNKNQLQLDYFNHLKETLDQAPGLNEPLSPSVVGVQDATFNKMIQKMGELISHRQVISFSARENNPTLVMIDQEIAQVNGNLKENLDNLIRNAQVQQQTLERQQQEILSQLNRLPKKEQDLINYKRRFELTNETYTYLLHRRAEIEIALAGATSDVRIIDAACHGTTYLTGFSPHYKLMMGLLSGLAFPGVLVLGSFFLSNTILRQEDIEEHTSLPVLGHIIHSRLATDTPVMDHPHSAIAEAYRNIRTSLQFMLPERERNIIAIHSIHPGEGKSFTSVNLATILAMNSKRVILVGCDMRKPRLHKIFNCSNDHGLSTFLSGQDELNAIIQPTRMENLWLLPAGPFPPNPTELLDHPRMERLLTQLSRQYDYVLLDNSPISLVSDGLVAGRNCHLNLFILRYGISKKEQIQYINQLTDNKLLGNMALLVNDISGMGFGAGTDYYYSKYHPYGNGYYEEPEVPVSRLKKVFGNKKTPNKNPHPMIG